MVQRHSAADCLRAPLVDTLPAPCKQLKKGFGECRRGMIDMRKRFRGNQPATFAALQAADRTGDGYQLYAGKSAFAAASSQDAEGPPSADRDWRELENEKYRRDMAERKLGEARGK